MAEWNKQGRVVGVAVREAEGAVLRADSAFTLRVAV